MIKGSDDIVHIDDFGVFFQKTYPAIYQLIQRYVIDENVAHDLAQDTFLRIYEKRTTMHSLTHARAYAYTVAKNLCLDYLKRQKVQSRYIESLPEDPIDDNQYLRQVTHVETVHIVKEALSILSDRSRSIIELSMEGKSNEEVAQILNISINTVKTIKKRAYQKLRKRLLHYYLTFILLVYLFFQFIFWY